MDTKNNKVFLPNGIEAVLAEYKVQEIEEYKNNPLIEALPPILLTCQVIQKLTVYPSINKEEKKLNPELRMHCIQRIFKYFQPLSNHLDLERRVSMVIRQGYIARNPFKPEYATSLISGHEMIKKSNLEPDTNSFRTTSSGFALIGISGIGKTTAMDRVLSLYPQVIVHSKYKEMHLNLYQITWLKLDCPYDGSVKGLCLDFFIKVDNLIGTNYHVKYGSGRHSVNALMPIMAQIAQTQGIGVLIIDEIQHLNLAKSGGSEKMLNFFVTLVNTIGVPVILIGTMKAISIFQSEFRQARRNSGQGDMIWEIIPKDEKWNVLMESMFEFQWTTGESVFTDELSDVLYDESQGIIDIAVKLFALAQMHAVLNGKKFITSQIIRIVAKENFQLVKPMLDALKSGNIERIMKYDDIRPVNIEAFCEQQIKKRENKEEIRLIQEFKNKIKQSGQQNEKDKKEFAITKLMELGIEAKNAKRYIEQIMKNEPNLQLIEIINKGLETLILEQKEQESKKQANSTTEKSRKTNLQSRKDENDLRKIVEDGKNKKLSAYDSLKDKGWIKPPLEDIFMWR